MGDLSLPQKFMYLVFPAPFMICCRCRAEAVPVPRPPPTNLPCLGICLASKDTQDKRRTQHGQVSFIMMDPRKNGVDICNCNCSECRNETLG